MKISASAEHIMYNTTPQVAYLPAHKHGTHNRLKIFMDQTSMAILIVVIYIYRKRGGSVVLLLL